MSFSNIIKSIILFLLSAVFTFILLLIYGNFTAEILFLYGIFGLAGYMILDSPSKFKINIVIKYIVAIISSAIRRIYDLNNYQADTREYEFMHLGRLVKHKAEIKEFRFIDLNDLFLIVLITTIMILIYLALKYLVNRIIKK